jgi:hypothetical protein
MSGNLVMNFICVEHGQVSFLLEQFALAYDLHAKTITGTVQYWFSCHYLIIG